MLNPTTKSTSQEDYYIYTLSYPDNVFDDDGQNLAGIVFYVGMGSWYKKSAVQRIDSHEKEALRAENNNLRTVPINPRKIQAIKRIWDAGKNITKQVVFESSNRRQIQLMEIALIRQYQSPYLTNILNTRSGIVNPKIKRMAASLTRPAKEHLRDENDVYYVLILSDPRSGRPELLSVTQNLDKPLGNGLYPNIASQKWLAAIRAEGLEPTINEKYQCSSKDEAERKAFMLLQEYFERLLPDNLSTEL